MNGNSRDKEKKHLLYRDGNVIDTVIMIIVIAVLFLTAYVLISRAIRTRSLSRMEEGVNTVMEEVTSKLARDSDILNATAEIIENTSFDEDADRLDVGALLDTMKSVAPLFDTMNLRVLLADERVVTADGRITDVSNVDNISFAEEAPRGEHVSNRVEAASGDLLRHFVPIQHDGRTVAMVYGVTMLADLPMAMNIDNIYNGTASVYIIDTRNGDFILDTWHDKLGNIGEYAMDRDPDRETKGEQTWDEYTEDIMALNTGYVVFRSDSTDGWEYMYYGPAGVNQWAIAVSVPEREAFASAFTVQRIGLAIGLVMVLAVALYYSVIHRRARQTMADAVERAVLEEKLKKAEAAERAKTTFLSNMSHDIRTPMNAIIGFTTLAQTNLDNKARVQEYLAKILSSGNHLLSLINDILDMSRIESGKLNIEEKPCSISDIFRDMRNIIQTQMQTKQLNFFMDTMDVTDEDIYCDKLHVNQVLLNLLSNAIKFTPAGGSVSMMISQKPGAPSGYGSYEIRVKDTGIGMSPEFAQHIFEPFERERNSTVSGIQGTGLGMAITKSIVDTMGGTIQVITAPNAGTEFIIDLQFRLQTQPRRVTEIRELNGMRGLVVDDSFATCDSVTKMLTQIGMRAEWTMHGQEAVLRARQAVEMGDEFYAYIIDWALPDLSGLEVVRQVRAIVGEHVPIIILTAYDWTAFEEEAVKAGVTAFCNKPIFISELRDVLVSALGKVDAPLPEKVLPDPVEELKGKRILLVEDNELNREIAQELLEESGFAVEMAEDGTVAVEKMSSSAPGYYDLVLMDIQMPIMNGYDAARAIRALPDPALAGVPIVAMTANAFDEDRRLALAAGMNDHVAKPIQVDKLIQVLIEQIEKGGSAARDQAQDQDQTRQTEPKA